MRSRSWSETATLVLGAVVDGVWCGALAAALAGASWPLLALFAAGVILCGALVARRLDMGGRGAGDGAGASAGDRGVLAARLLAVGLVVGAAGVLLLAGRAWDHPALLWQAAGDAVFAAGLVAVGVHLGRASRAPDVAVRRAVRAFALLCAILVAAALARTEPGWAAPAVVVSLAAGGLLIAIARYDDLTGLVAPSERMPAWPWLLAVAGAVLAVVAVGALLSLVFQVGGVLWVLHGLGAALRYALDAVGYAIAYAGMLLARALSWAIGLLHMRPWYKWAPPMKLKPPTISGNASSYKYPSVSRLAGTIVGTVLAIGGLLAIVVFSLRRIRRTSPVEPSVVEEREELSSLRSAAGQFAGRLGRRLRSRIGGLFGREPDTPAERVRRRYAELERRLTKAGRPRPAGLTVREYLAQAAAPDDADLPVTSAGAGPAAQPPAASQPAADLAAIYELARYSEHEVDACQAERFQSLALAIES